VADDDSNDDGEAALSEEEAKMIRAKSIARSKKKQTGDISKSGEVKNEKEFPFDDYGDIDQDDDYDDEQTRLSILKEMEESVVAPPPVTISEKSRTMKIEPESDSSSASNDDRMNVMEGEWI